MAALQAQQAQLLQALAAAQAQAEAEAEAKRVADAKAEADRKAEAEKAEADRKAAEKKAEDDKKKKKAEAAKKAAERKSEAPPKKSTGESSKKRAPKSKPTIASDMDIDEEEIVATNLKRVQSEDRKRTRRPDSGEETEYEAEEHCDRCVAAKRECLWVKRGKQKVCEACYKQKKKCLVGGVQKSGQKRPRNRGVPKVNWAEMPLPEDDESASTTESTAHLSDHEFRGELVAAAQNQEETLYRTNRLLVRMIQEVRGVQSRLDRVADLMEAVLVAGSSTGAGTREGAEKKRDEAEKEKEKEKEKGKEKESEEAEKEKSEKKERPKPKPKAKPSVKGKEVADDEELEEIEDADGDGDVEME